MRPRLTTFILSGLLLALFGCNSGNPYYQQRYWNSAYNNSYGYPYGNHHQSYTYPYTSGRSTYYATHYGTQFIPVTYYPDGHARGNSYFNYYYNRGADYPHFRSYYACLYRPRHIRYSYAEYCNFTGPYAYYNTVGGYLDSALTALYARNARKVREGIRHAIASLPENHDLAGHLHRIDVTNDPYDEVEEHLMGALNTVGMGLRRKSPRS